MITLGFYFGIPHIPWHREFIFQIFCSHPLEYATTCLFFIGTTILAMKGWHLRTEKKAFHAEYLNQQALWEQTNSQEKSFWLTESINNLPVSQRRTWLTTRISDLANYIRGKRSTVGLEDHLKYLAEMAAEQLHGSHALVRTITWAVPILGFLGTVIGITIAIANVTPEQLDTSLGNVTSGLAVAFDTTALALALSLLLVFSSFLAERSEQQILARVEEFGFNRLVPLFPSDEQFKQSPLIEAEAQAANILIERTESLINEQTQLWQKSIETLRKRWSETLEGQKKEFDSALQQGMSATLNDHQQQLADLRSEFLGLFENLSNQLVNNVGERVESWQSQLHQSTESNLIQFKEIQKQGDRLAQVVEQEQELARLQQQLNANLEALRATEAFEETMHSLSAAVHLLTTRVKPHAA